MKLLTDSKEFKSTFLDLFKKCKRFSFAVAWASPIEGIFQVILQNKRKIDKGIVGLHFYQTDSDFIREFIGSNKVKFFPLTSGTFHPKIYLFENNDGWTLIVGSANFTNAAFSKNYEASLMVTNNDTDAKKTLDAVVNILKEYKKKAKTFTKADLDRYEFISDQQQDMLDSFSDDDGEKKNPSKIEFSKPFYLSKYSTLSWNEFRNRVEKETGKDGPRFEKRIKLLCTVEKIFNKQDKRTGRYLSFSEYTLDERRIIAGLKLNNESEYYYKIAPGFFGQMSVSRKLYTFVSENSTCKIISKALDCIPREGLVEKKHYDKFVQEITSIKNIALGIATRFLAMKRPDIFVCFDSANERRLCEDFGIKLSTRKEKRFEDYWEKIICKIKKCKWWKLPRPAKGDDLIIWKNRAAFLDSISYED